MSAAPGTSGYRKATSEQRPVRELSFDRLPPTVQSALVRSLAEHGAPRPLFSEVSGERPPSSRRWAWFVGAAAATELVAWILGFGDRVDDPPLSPMALAGMHAVAIAAGLFAAVYLLRVRKSYLGVPYPAGKHVFELDLVEVEGTRVRVTPLDTLRHIEARPGASSPSVALVFTDGHEVVLRNQPDAEALVPSARAAIEAARGMVFPQDLEHLEKVDPFLELRIGADWHPPAPVASTSPLGRLGTSIAKVPLRAAAAVALVTGLLAGTGTFFLGRRHLVDLDDARFQAALHHPSNPEYELQTYLDRGGRHVEEAEAELFEQRRGDSRALQRYVDAGGPRAAIAAERLFEVERRDNDVDALAAHVQKGDAFAERADEALFAMASIRRTSGDYQVYLAKGGRRHEAEVRSKLLPKALFDEALRERTTTALRRFATKYPDSPYSKQALTELHHIYTDAFDRYVQVNQPPPAARRFVQALFALMEETDEHAVSVRVAVSDLTPVVDADKAGAAANGDAYQPALPYVQRVADVVRRELQTWMGESFVGGLARPTDWALDPEGKRPLVDVTLTPVLDGDLVSRREKLHFSSVKFKMSFRATIPGKPETLTWSTTSRGLQTFDFSVRAADDAGVRTDRDDFSSKVYGNMVEDTVQVFRDRLEERL